MLAAVRIWIIISSLLVGSGWLLSALHELNRGGYVVIFTLASAAFIWWIKRRQASLKQSFHKLWGNGKRRFRRAAPALFLALVVLSLISGGLYPGLNWDANAYRLPRMFHWLAENGWHVIAAPDARMNISACGQEWLATPLLAFSHSDRLIFLINWVSFLMLPGLIFSVFIRLKVSPRVAWWWMWFLAAGWCFVLQASSIGNDGFAAVYALAAVDLALRAREKQNVKDLWLSGLAVALLSGVKQTNLPLMLPWLVAAWPSRHLIYRYLTVSSAMALACLLVSVVPISLLNWHYYGSWLPLENTDLSAVGKFHLNPFWGVIGNLFCIPLQNMLPPFYEFVPPFYDYLIPFWDEMVQRFIHTSLGGHFASFEKFGYLSASYYYSVCEANAGIGLGAGLLVLAGFYEGRRLNRGRSVPVVVHWRSRLSLSSAMPWLSLFIFMAKVGTFENARHLAPYYLLLFPVLLTGAWSIVVVRHRLWQRLGYAVMILTALLVIAQPPRPLFPAQILIAFLGEKFPNSGLVANEGRRYIWNFFHAIDLHRQWLEKKLPADEKVIGYYAGSLDVDESGIWLPWGRHRPSYVSLNDSPETLREKGIHYLVVTANGLTKTKVDLNDITTRYNGSVAGVCPFFGGDKSCPPAFAKMEWLYLIRLN